MYPADQALDVLLTAQTAAHVSLIRTSQIQWPKQRIIMSGPLTVNVSHEALHKAHLNNFGVLSPAEQGMAR